MLSHSKVPSTGSLVIVEAGAKVPATIFAREQSSDHAVIRQSDGESLSQVLRRAQRRIWEFVASSVQLTNVVVVISDGATDGDMATRELLGRSLLQLQHAGGASLSFVAQQGDTVFAEKLLGIVGRLLDGTRDQSVNVTLGPMRNRKHKANEAHVVAA